MDFRTHLVTRRIEESTEIYHVWMGDESHYLQFTVLFRNTFAAMQYTVSIMAWSSHIKP